MAEASFRSLSGSVLAAPQIEAADIARARAAGVTLIVQNRPDGEEEGQPGSAQLAAAAAEHGIDFRLVPVSDAGFGAPQVEAMRAALDSAQGKTLAFCRSGTRSTLLWALAEASRGGDPGAIAGDAAAAGYDVAPVRPAMDMLAAARD